MKILKILIALVYCLLILALADGCTLTAYHPTNTPPPTPTPTPPAADFYHSTPRFQVFILNPVHTCIASNDFYSGDVAYGKNCGDHNCEGAEFDPPAPLSGIKPENINDPQYAGYEYRECFNITLTDQEIQAIKDDILFSRDMVYKWTDGALDLQVEFTILPHDFTGFVAPDFVFGPFEVDDELLTPYVSADTDLIYVFTGVRDLEKGVDLAYWCGSSYGEYSIRGASYSYIQYNDTACNTVKISDRQVYEATLHELYHNIDWALYYLDDVPDLYQNTGPDWGKWDHSSWSACGTGDSNPVNWFPSIDFCEWDPDWMDCNNLASAGMCVHAGDIDGQPSWYEHVMRAHYPRFVHFNANSCQDGKQDFGETGVDIGGPCP